MRVIGCGHCAPSAYLTCINAVALQPPAQRSGFMTSELGALQGGTLASGDGEIDVDHIAKVTNFGYIVRVDERTANLEELHGAPAFLVLVGTADTHWACQPSHL